MPEAGKKQATFWSPRGTTILGSNFQHFSSHAHWQGAGKVWDTHTHIHTLMSSPLPLFNKLQEFFVTWKTAYKQNSWEHFLLLYRGQANSSDKPPCNLFWISQRFEPFFHRTQKKYSSQEWRRQETPTLLVFPRREHVSAAIWIAKSKSLCKEIWRLWRGYDEQKGDDITMISKGPNPTQLFGAHAATIQRYGWRKP